MSGIAPLFSPRNSIPGVYNFDATKLPRLQGAIADVMNGKGNALLGIAGESVVAGAGSNGSLTADIVNLSMPAALGRILNVSGLPTEWRSATFGDHNITPSGSGADPRLVWGAGWGVGPSAIGHTILNTTTTVSGTTNALSFAPGISFDRIVVFYVGGVTGSFTVDIGGGTLSTITTNATTGYFKSNPISCAPGTNTVYINRVSGSAYISGIWVYDSANPKLHIFNIGQNGVTVSYWNSTTNPYSARAAMAALGLHAVFLEDMINDWNAGTSLASFQSDMQGAIAAWTPTMDMMVIGPNPTQTASGADAATQAAYRAAGKATALAYGLPYVDFSELLVSYAVANGYSQMFDLTHPNDRGYFREAAQIARLVRGY